MEVEAGALVTVVVGATQAVQTMVVAVVTVIGVGAHALLLQEVMVITVGNGQ